MSDDFPANEPAPTAGTGRVAVSDDTTNDARQIDDRPARDGWPEWGQPASIGKRAGAYIIDYLAVNIVLAVVGVRAGLVPLNAESMTQDQAYLAGVIASGAALVYFVACEAAFGQTLAKRLLGICVVMADGTRVTLLAALTRRVPFFAGMVVPLVGALFNFAVPLTALITAIQDEPTGRGFHDRWAGTRVVEGRSRGRLRGRS
ncbi:MAG: RDD family protein [Actinobacteria bacterium]|nr:RDD family protein [Actinomycetota bacterium]